MIVAVKEQYAGLRIYNGSPLAAKTFASVRPLFWGNKGVDEVVVTFRGEPTPGLKTVAESYRSRLAEELVGKPQKAMVDWIENVEFEEEWSDDGVNHRKNC